MGIRQEKPTRLTAEREAEIVKMIPEIKDEAVAGALQDLSQEIALLRAEREVRDLPYERRASRIQALEEAASIVENGCPDTPEWADRKIWLGRAAAAVRDIINEAPEPEGDVHTEHCCIEHGCKYGDDDACTVASERKPQSFSCVELDCDAVEDDEDNEYYESDEDDLDSIGSEDEDLR